MQQGDKIELTELSNKLFMYCDAFQWEKMIDEVFTDEVWFDMTSAGGDAKKMRATEICAMWMEGLSGLDALHHQAGHYLIDINGTSADIYGYAIALHYRKAATKGHSRTFVGSYDLKAEKTKRGWRLNQFKYNLKFIEGNAGLD